MSRRSHFPWAPVVAVTLLALFAGGVVWAMMEKVKAIRERAKAAPVAADAPKPPTPVPHAPAAGPVVKADPAPAAPADDPLWLRDECTFRDLAAHLTLRGLTTTFGGSGGRSVVFYMNPGRADVQLNVTRYDSPADARQVSGAMSELHAVAGRFVFTARLTDSDALRTDETAQAIRRVGEIVEADLKAKR